MVILQLLPSLLLRLMPGCVPSWGFGFLPFFLMRGGKPISPMKKSSDEDVGEAVEGGRRWFGEGPRRGEGRPV